MRHFILCCLLLIGSAVQAQSEDEPRAIAIFAGGCFWCMEPPYDKLDGVVSTTSGYIGGKSRTANYKAVSKGGTQHYEALKVEYLPSKVSFERLLEVFWVNIDPLDDKGQFCDKGSQYLSAIFYLDEEQKTLAEASKQALEKSGKLNAPIVTPIIEASEFYAAEEYHQDYYLKNPFRYKFYRNGCRRDERLKALWGKP